MSDTREASCSCGQLRLRVQGEPLGVGVCHCLACQRRTGSVFATLASFAAPYEVRGETSVHRRVGEQGVAFRFPFCPQCGSTVLHTEEGQDDSISVAVGTLADPGFAPPTVSVYESRRHGWVRLPDELTRFVRDPH